MFSDTDIYIKADHSVRASAKVAKTALEKKYSTKMDWAKLKTKVLNTLNERVATRLQKMLMAKSRGQGSIFDKGEGTGSDGEDVPEPVMQGKRKEVKASKSP